MRRSIAAAVLAGLVMTGAAAGGQSALPRISVREAMADHINPATIAIWEVTNAARAEDGGLDSALMDDPAWEKLAGAAGVLHSDSALLSAQPKLLVVQPGQAGGQSIAESAYTAEQIQHFINADPATFRMLAQQLALSASDLLKAARARDSARAGQIAGELEILCERCHQQYWYPAT